MEGLIVGTSILAVLITWAGVHWFRSWAEKRRIMDLPNERSSHTRPTPRGGGLVIAAVTLVLGAVPVVLYGAAGSIRMFLAYAAGAAVIVTISWFDDIRSVNRWLRLSVHILGAALAMWGIAFWGSLTLPFLGPVHLGWMGALVTLVWIVGLTNAYNFMDGIDGIAAGQAVVAGLFWWIIARQYGLPMSSLGLLAAATSLGFLLHNWPPARIFMGDAGSAFLGYTLAALPLTGTAIWTPGVGLTLGVLCVWPFVFDTVFTIARRLLRRENVFEAHRSHLYQRLAIVGWSHRAVTLLYLGLAAVGCVIAALWGFTSTGGDLRLPSLVLIPAALLWALVVTQERKYASRVRMQS